MGRPRQRRLDPRSIAALDVKTAVVGQVRPDPGGIGLQRGQRVGHRVAPLIVGDDRVGGILGGIPRLGQHHGHRVADILHQVLGQRTHLGDAHLAPVGAGMAQPWLDRPDSVLGLLRAGQNRHHARHRPGLGYVKRHQPRRRNRAIAGSPFPARRHVAGRSHRIPRPSQGADPLCAAAIARFSTCTTSTQFINRGQWPPLTRGAPCQPYCHTLIQCAM